MPTPSGEGLRCGPGWMSGPALLRQRVCPSTPLPPGGDEIDILRRLRRLGRVVLDDGAVAYPPAYQLSRRFVRAVIKSRSVR